MPTKYNIVTKTGDNGVTSLWSGQRVSKGCDQIECVGSVDELHKALGLIHPKDEFHKCRLLFKVQQHLIILMGELALYDSSARSKVKKRINNSHVAFLTRKCDYLLTQVDLESQTTKGWTIHGTGELSARLDWATGVCRRAERQLVRFNDQMDRHIQFNKDRKFRPQLLVYLNRLSDLLYLLARHCQL